MLLDFNIFNNFTQASVSHLYHMLHSFLIKFKMLHVNIQVIWCTTRIINNSEKPLKVHKPICSKGRYKPSEKHSGLLQEVVGHKEKYSMVWTSWLTVLNNI